MALDERLATKFAALPIHSPQRHERLSLDPRLAQEFVQSGSVGPETKAQLTGYIVTAKWSAPERAVYGAVVEGFTSVEELETVTGMTRGKIQSTVDRLQKKGVLRKVSETSRV